MEWSLLGFPLWLRWLAAFISAIMLPLLFMVFSGVGKNISETYLTKGNHQLVTHDPYCWIWHPLCTVATMMLLSLSIVAANRFMMVMALIAFAAIAVFVVPGKEDELIYKFGNEYLEYQKRTGRLVPLIHYPPRKP